MKHWSDPDIYVQVRNETGSTDWLRKFFHLTHLNEKKTVLISRKTINLIIPSTSCLYNIDFWIFLLLCLVILISKIKATLSRKYDQITIPLAICQAKENSCLVEKPSSSSSSSDSCRSSFEIDIAEACLCPGDADVLGSSSSSVTLNCSSYNQIL